MGNPKQAIDIASEDESDTANRSHNYRKSGQMDVASDDGDDSDGSHRSSKRVELELSGRYSPAGTVVTRRESPLRARSSQHSDAGTPGSELVPRPTWDKMAWPPARFLSGNTIFLGSYPRAESFKRPTRVVTPSSEDREGQLSSSARSTSEWRMSIISSQQGVSSEAPTPAIPEDRTEPAMREEGEMSDNPDDNRVRSSSTNRRWPYEDRGKPERSREQPSLYSTSRRCPDSMTLRRMAEAMSLRNRSTGRFETRAWNMPDKRQQGVTVGNFLSLPMNRIIPPTAKPASLEMLWRWNNQIVGSSTEGSARANRWLRALGQEPSRQVQEIPKLRWNQEV